MEYSFNELKGHIHDDSLTSMTEMYVHYFSSEGREKRVQELVEKIRNNESNWGSKEEKANQGI